MKLLATSSHSCRLGAWLRTGATALAALVALSACQDELLNDGSNGGYGDGRLHFSVQTDSKGWTTRTAADDASAGTTSYTLKAKDDSLYLHASVTPTTTGIKTETVQTRGTIVQAGGKYDTLGLFGYTYEGDWNDVAASITPNFMYNTNLNYTGNGTVHNYATDQIYYMPTGGAKVRLFAYAPKGIYGTQVGRFLTLPERTATGVPEFSYTVPVHSPNQVDLSFSSGVETTDGNVTLQMHHALAAIKFVADETLDNKNVVINTITFQNVYNVGTYTPALTGVGTWNVDEAETASITVQDYTGTDSGEGPLGIAIPADLQDGRSILAADQTFFMMPYEYPTGSKAQIEIGFTQNGGTPLTKEFSLAGHTFTAGTTVTFTLSYTEDEYDLVIRDASDKEINYLETGHFGEEKELHITSKKNGAGINYNLRFSTDGGKTWVENTAGVKPGMIGSTPKEPGNNQIPANGIWTHKINITHAPSYVTGPDVTALQNATNWSNTTFQNLSSNSANETANCYIVSAGGYYRFRAVYGNAYANGRNTNVLSKGYVNGAGQEITADNMNLTNFYARLIWEDVEGLVTVERTPYYNDGMHFINITVGGSADTYTQILRPGNALIGAYDNSSGTLLWSWHIWVTPAPGEGTVQGKTFMKYPLGYVEGGDTHALERECLMQAYIPNTEPLQVSNTVTIKQTKNGFTEGVEPGRYPTYQWGRKEPMWPGSTLSNGSSTSILFGPNVPTSIPSGTLSTPQARIQNPFIFRNDYSATISANLWNAAASGSSTTTGNVTKSIYDPCPPGYHVPNSDAFNSFIYNYYGWSYNFANSRDKIYYGNFYTNTASSSGIYYSFSINNDQVYMPFGGYRAYPDFQLNNTIGSLLNGGSWTAGRMNAQNGSGIISVVAYMQYFSSGAFQFWPRYGVDPVPTGTIDPSAFADYRHSWPVIPQRGN